MTWRVQLGPGSGPLVAEVLEAQRIWRLLTDKQQAAMLAAYPDKRVVGHPLTLNSLERKGLMTGEPKLTDAGRVIVKWNRP